MPTIFISYRRSDTKELVNRIWESLVNVWGEDKVFKDTDSFLAGPDFRKQMSRYIQRSNIVLVIIGQNWAGVSSETGLSRIFDDTDPVRTEIEEAIKLGKLIIPVLVNSRTMPELSDLPESIRELRNNNAFRIHDDSTFTRDMNRLNGYFVHPELIELMGKDALPSDMQPFEEPTGITGHNVLGVRIVLCCWILVFYWLTIGYLTPWLFPPEILRISGSNSMLMRVWGNDGGLERFKVLVVVVSLTVDFAFVGIIVSYLFHESLFAISDFAAAMLFGSLQLLVAAIILSIGRGLERSGYIYRNVINLRKTLLVISTNALLTYTSSFQFLGISYLYFPVFASVVSASLFVYTLVGIGLASYSDNLSGMNRVLERRKLRQERASLFSREYAERISALRIRK